MERAENLAAVLAENADREAIAIIGMACLFPEAPNLEAFWRNILSKLDTIGDPEPSWDAARYLESGRIHTSQGGYLKDLYRFAPGPFGIMPNSVDGGEPDQFLALEIARNALQDAGWLTEYDHRETGIVLGHSTYLHRGQGNLIQHNIVLDQTVELLRSLLPNLDESRLSELRRLLQAKLPQFNADVAPSLVPNVMTGRIANRLDLQGPNYLIDAACSSSLLAVNAAMDELRSGRSRLMLAGGVNASLPAEVSVIFSLLGALSGSGKVRPFESGSDGTLLGEGLGVVVLKRVGDAIAEGDRIYALIRGVGQASDGRGHGILAPSLEGETLAIERAYANSGVDPASIGLIEAHGTGIPLGDQTEIAALRRVLGERKGRLGSVAIGSVKSMISHCIPAAGIAGLIKVALALHEKILPPTLCEKVNPELGLEHTPLYVNTETRPWIEKPERPRRAGVNAFGFGGINAHAILEEVPPALPQPPKFAPWEAELCAFEAAEVDALVDELERLEGFLDRSPTVKLKDVAAALQRRRRDPPQASCRLAIVARDTGDLAKKLVQARKRLKKNDDVRWSTRAGVFYSREPVEGCLAFLFPGEGSQYLGMFSQLAVHFDEVREWLDFWHGLYDDPAGSTRTDILLPPDTELTDARRAELERRLHDMDVGSEAVFIGGRAMHSLLTSFGVRADAMVGHSSGESSALSVCGAVGDGTHSQLARFTRGMNATYQRILDKGLIPTGALLTVGALPRDVIQRQIAATDGRAFLAMENCGNQLVLYADPETIAGLETSLTEAGGITMRLPFDRGYHTPMFEPVRDAFSRYYREAGLGPPATPLYSCASAGLFPDDAEAACELAASQWSRTVRFRETVERMHDDGVRYFVEVGPSGNLSSFVTDILSKRDYLAIPTNTRRRGDLEQFLTALSQLYVNRRELELEKLYRDRAIAELDLDGAFSQPTRGLRLDNTMPMVRFDDAERMQLRALLSVETSPPSQSSQPDGSNIARSAPEDDSLSDVMASQLDLMQTVVQSQSGTLAPTSQAIDPIADEAVNDVEGFTPFLSAIRELSADRLVAECRLSAREDRYLRHHVLSGNVSAVDPDLLGLSCVPLMVSLEILAEACALLDGSTELRVIENVRAMEWIALDQGEALLEVHVELLDASNRRYRAELRNEGRPVLTADYSFLPAWTTLGLAELPERRESRWNGPELYSTGMFHGPLFQSVQHIHGWSDSGIDARLSPVSLTGFFRPGERSSMVLNPILLDALGQLAAYWIANQVGTNFNCFPSTIGRIELYCECPENIAGLELRARQSTRDPGSLAIDAPRAWHFECLDASGQPLLRVSDLVNVYFDVPERYVDVRRDPLTGWLGRPSSGVLKTGITLWETEHLPAAFLSQSSEIFARILAHAILCEEERQEWSDLSGSRKRQWLLGRACLKEAVRWWIHQETGHLPHPAEVVVRHDPQGAPWVDGWWRDELIAAPAVSLSHDRYMSVVAVASPGSRVGVDSERIGRVQHPQHVVESFTDDEQRMVQGLEAEPLQEKLLRIWCAKEAAAKAIGLGLEGNPTAFDVRFWSDTCDLATVRHCDGEIDVALSRRGDVIIALAS